jgi:hypothetical protein
MVTIKKSHKPNSKNNPAINLALNNKKITRKSIIKVPSYGRRY